jgi:putative hydrolases of HD superfamily
MLKPTETKTFRLPSASDPNLVSILGFLNELEHLKKVYRQNLVIDGSRRENSAEHSWHIALMALTLEPYSNFPALDMPKVVKMLLLHDVVEIDAGDVFAYDAKALVGKYERELAAARRLFGLLPSPQGNDFLNLWLEFEARETAEAKFAAAIDSFHPLSNHLLSDGKGVQKYRLPTSIVLAEKKHIAEGSLALWAVAQDIIAQSEKEGIYFPD